MQKRIIGQIAIGLIALAVFIYLFVNHYENVIKEATGKYEYQRELYVKKARQVLELEEARKKERDSLVSEIKNREDKTLQLVDKNKSLEERINKIKDKKITVPENIPGLVNYFNTRYLTQENSAIDNKVGLGQKTAQSTIYELEEKDSFSEIIEIKDEQIVLKDEIIDYLEKDKQDLFKMFDAAENEIEERKTLQQMADENINTLEKQVKTLKKTNKLNKVLIPVGFLVGGFVGYKIAK